MMLNYAVQHRTRAKVPFSGCSQGQSPAMRLPFEFAKNMFGASDFWRWACRNAKAESLWPRTGVGADDTRTVAWACVWSDALLLLEDPCDPFSCQDGPDGEEDRSFKSQLFFILSISIPTLSEKNHKEWPRQRWFHHNFPEVVSLCPFLRPFCWFFPSLSGLDGRSPAWTMGKRPPWALFSMVKRASHTMLSNQGVSAASPVQDFGTFSQSLADSRHTNTYLVITSSGVIPKCDSVNEGGFRRFAASNVYMKFSARAATRNFPSLVAMFIRYSRIYRVDWVDPVSVRLARTTHGKCRQQRPVNIWNPKTLSCWLNGKEWQRHTICKSKGWATT